MGNKNLPNHQKQAETDIRRSYYWDNVMTRGRIYPKFHLPSVDMLFNLIFTYDVARAHFTKRLAKYGLSISAFNVLTILSREERKGYKQQELSRLMLVSRANITGLIDSLARRGLVCREADKKDRRVCIASITVAGKMLIEKILPSHFEEMARVCSGMSSREKKTLSELLTKLRAGFPRSRT